MAISNNYVFSITKCESSGCVYGFSDLESGKAVIGDSDTKLFVERGLKEVEAWLQSVAVGETVDRPPLAQHDHDGFELRDDTLYVPTSNYDKFVADLRETGQFAGITVVPQQVMVG